MPFPISTAAWVLVPGAALLLGAQAIPSVPSPSVVAAAQPPSSSVAAATPLTQHVVVISIDGLRPDAIEKFGAETLQRLMREGSYTLAAKTIMPSRTLPSHTSMLTGEEPEEHGITWNRNHTDEHGHVAVPTVFAQAHARGLHAAAFFSKGKFHHLNAPNTLTHSVAPEGNGSWSARQTVEHVKTYLASARPNLMFVHFREPDHAGHRFSWMSWPYARAVRQADRAVAEVLESADEAFGRGNYSVIVTSDHGGHGWDHGSSDARDVTIPWIAWGQGVEGGTVLPEGIRTMDTAATALWLLGIAESTEGEPVRTAFVPTEPPLARAAALERR